MPHAISQSESPFVSSEKKEGRRNEGTKEGRAGEGGKVRLPAAAALALSHAPTRCWLSGPPASGCALQRRFPRPFEKKKKRDRTEKQGYFGMEMLRYMKGASVNQGTGILLVSSSLGVIPSLVPAGTGKGLHSFVQAGSSMFF